MKVGGFQKVSLIDYPGKLSAILFTQGCNLRCPYCHNPELVDPDRYGPLIGQEEILAFLEKRKGKLDALAVTGGEPLLQKNLAGFLDAVKKMGYLVKLDTNGTFPDELDALLREGLIDYIAMDIKGPLKAYEAITASKVDTAKIRRSIEIIRSSGLRHEFRTTVVRTQLTPRDLTAVAGLIGKGDLYVLQPFIPGKTLKDAFASEVSYSPEEFSRIRAALSGKGQNVQVRLSA